MKYDPITATFEVEDHDLHRFEGEGGPPIKEAPTLELHDRFEQVQGD